METVGNRTAGPECGRPRPQRRPHARGPSESVRTFLRSASLRPGTGALRGHAETILLRMA